MSRTKAEQEIDDFLEKKEFYKGWSSGSLALRFWRNEKEMDRIRSEIRIMKSKLGFIQQDQQVLDDLLGKGEEVSDA